MAEGHFGYFVKEFVYRHMVMMVRFFFGTFLSAACDIMLKDGLLFCEAGSTLRNLTCLYFFLNR